MLKFIFFIGAIFFSGVVGNENSTGIKLQAWKIVNEALSSGIEVLHEAENLADTNIGDFKLQITNFDYQLHEKYFPIRSSVWNEISIALEEESNYTIGECLLMKLNYDETKWEAVEKFGSCMNENFIHIAENKTRELKNNYISFLRNLINLKTQFIDSKNFLGSSLDHFSTFIGAQLSFFSKKIGDTVFSITQLLTKSEICHQLKEIHFFNERSLHVVNDVKGCIKIKKELSEYVKLK
ncbi:uncharacterized protein LOC127277548 [Leptopilina boulardi]|uniref:uncharacterized protein LOC127277548 n=1 Tax=Leptopilina boulardi TaxID=63433 RepID=UPI0021F53968|nr:uncharacterized protein LOC127277548 [Leptopilina boulardi]